MCTSGNIPQTRIMDTHSRECISISTKQHLKNPALMPYKGVITLASVNIPQVDDSRLVPPPASVFPSGLNEILEIP